MNRSFRTGLFLACLLAAALPSLSQRAANSREPLYDFNFFRHSLMTGDYFFSRTIATGGSVLQSSRGRIPVVAQPAHSPGNSLRLTFTDGKQGSWEALVQATEVRGRDHFADPAYLSVWLFVPPAQQSFGSMPEVLLKKKDSSLSPSVFLQSSIKDHWAQVLIPVSEFGMKGTAAELDEVAAIVFRQGAKDGVKHELFLDDIEFLPPNYKTEIRQKPQGLMAKGYLKHIDLSWTPVTDTAVKYVKIWRSDDDTIYHAVGMQSAFTPRYADYTNETGRQYFYKISFLSRAYREYTPTVAVKTATRSMSDEELLDMVQEASFRYYWEGAEKSSGLAKENTEGRRNMIATGASGFGMLALITGVERKFITRAEAVQRSTQIIAFLEKADKFHGVFPHFIDGPSGKVETFFGKRDNGGDLVEHSFLMQGLLGARAYLNGKDSAETAIRDGITRLWKNTEWDWYRRYPDSKFLYWHWSPDQAWTINHRLIGWNETMITYLLAIASPTHSVPASLYYSGWANQDSTGRDYRADWGQTTDGSMYTNGKTYYGVKLDVGVSNGGPLFFTHYSYLGYDPHLLNDRYTNYFTNNQHIAQINLRYCIDNPARHRGYSDSSWGLTACDGPYGYSADEPVLRQDRGKIGPTGALASFPYTPVESMKALRNYYNNYGSFLWGEYGFRDAFNLDQNWVADIYMGLNQAPQAVMIENFRTGLLWRLFMSDPDIKTGLDRLGKATKSKR